MDLIGSQVELPNVAIVRDEHFDNAVGAYAVFGSGEASQKPWLSSISRPCQLDTGGNAVSGWVNGFFEFCAKFDGYVGSVLYPG